MRLGSRKRLCAQTQSDTKNAKEELEAQGFLSKDLGREAVADNGRRRSAYQSADTA